MSVNPSPELTQLLSKLDGVKRSGNNWTAKCPAHADNTASLSIADGDEGVVLTCFAGCETIDIIGTLGMNWSDLFPEPEKETWEKVQDYRYTDADGTLLFTKTRWLKPNGQKSFSISHQLSGGGWERGYGDRPHVLYNLPKVLKTASEGGHVIICYADDTEVLTTDGWMSFPEARGSKIAQWSPDGSIEFVEPTAWQEFAYQGEMVHFRSEFSDLLVTPDHRQPARRVGCKPKVMLAREMTGFNWSLPVSGYAPGSNPVTDAEARLIAAWQADGVDERRGFKVSWNLKKNRKKDRLRSILSDLKVEWSEHHPLSTPMWTGFRVLRSDLPLHLIDGKILSWSMLDWSLSARQAFLTELAYWDGDRRAANSFRFFTSDEQSAQVVSALAAISGFNCTLRTQERPNRPGHQTEYTLNLGRKTERTMAREPERTEYNGTVYCCTVPSSFLVTRRNGKTVISGNCEGEKDAHTVESLGFTATTNPGGAGPGKWLDIHTEALKGAKVTIIGDRDRTGKRHVQEIKEALDAAGVQVVKMCEAPQGFKDISDMASRGKGLSDLIPWQPPQYAFEDYLNDLKEAAKSERDEDQLYSYANRMLTKLHLSDHDKPVKILDWKEWLDQNTDDSYDWIIENLLEACERLICVAPEGTGKSHLARQVAIMAACGIHPFNQFKRISPVRTLTYDLENPDKILQRNSRKIMDLAVRHSGNSNPFAKLIIQPAGLNLLTETGRNMLESAVADAKPQILFMGPLYKAFVDPGNRSAEAVATELAMFYDYIRTEYGCALWLEQHAPLGNSMSGRDLRPFGSAVWSRWPEFGISLKANETEPGLYDVGHFRGARDQRDFPAALRRGGPGNFPFVAAQ